MLRFFLDVADHMLSNVSNSRIEAIPMKFVEKVIERFQQKKPVAVMTRMLLANTLSASCMDRKFGLPIGWRVPGSTLATLTTIGDMAPSWS